MSKTRYVPVECLECQQTRMIGFRCERDLRAARARPCLKCSALHRAKNRGPSRKRDVIVDEIVVLRLVQGRRPERTNGPERREAVKVLTQRGWSARRIAEHIQTTTRTVERLRASA